MPIAPYFGTDLGNSEEYPADEVATWNVFRVIDEIRQVLLPRVYTDIEQQAATVQKYDNKRIKLVAYEGKQHLVGVFGNENNEQLNALFDAVNRSPLIGQVYLEYLREWKTRSGGMFVHFSSTSPYEKFGRWGALEYLTQPRESAPKFDALLKFIDENR